MAAIIRNFRMDQGATWEWGFVYCESAVVNGEKVPGPPYDLTGCYARMQIRKKKGEPVLVTANSGADEDSGGRRITLGADGRIDIVLTDQDTDQLNVKKAVYDFELVWPEQPGDLRPEVDRLLQGEIIVDLNITEDVA